MKKIIFLLFMGMFFLSCSNDGKDSYLEQSPKSLVFEVTAKTQLNETKAGAPIYSQDAAQSISRVTILAFKKSGIYYLYTKTYEITDWAIGSTSRSYVVPEGDKVPEGDYKFLAIGRDASDLYYLSTIDATTNIDDVKVSILASGDEYELFSGMAQAQVYAEGARVSLTITRKVAGIMGYFENVPQILDGKTVRYLRLTASAGNKQVNLSSGIGSSSTTSYNIFNIDLGTQSVANEIYTGNDLSVAGVVKLPNSQLSGAYMTPVDGITFTLGLYDATNAAIKTWAVNEGASTTFNIQANHFYSLGVKHKPNTTVGADLNDSGDDDNAIDLLQDQVITITIDPAWSTIHPLVLQ